MGVRISDRCARCDAPSSSNVCRRCRKALSARAGFLTAARGAGLASPSAEVASPANSFGALVFAPHAAAASTSAPSIAAVHDVLVAARSDVASHKEARGST